MKFLKEGGRRGLVNKKRIFRYNRKIVKKIYFRHIQPIIRTFICVWGGGLQKETGNGTKRIGWRVHKLGVKPDFIKVCEGGARIKSQEV